MLGRKTPMSRLNSFLANTLVAYRVFEVMKSADRDVGRYKSIEIAMDDVYSEEMVRQILSGFLLRARCYMRKKAVPNRADPKSKPSVC
jgi:hypothetical protein